MKRHIFLIPLLFCAATGCSGLPGLLSFEDSKPAPQEAAPVQSVANPAASQDISDEFCRRVAASAAAESASSGFDEATRQRMAQQNYQQCMMMGRAG